MFWNNLLGWFGAFLILFAYFLLIHKNLTSRSRMYQWMNIMGSIFLATNTLMLKSYPSFFTNIIWFIIGLYGMFHIIKHRKSLRLKKKWIKKR